jgi:hypothetical protein
MTTQQAVGIEPAWLWQSLRYRFWRPDDLARSMRHARLEPEQRGPAAWWWALLAAADGLGPRVYAAAFVRATEQGESDQVRWSLLAMLGDEVQHEELLRLGTRCLAAGAPLGRQARQHLCRVDQQADRCWNDCRRALSRGGIGAVSGAMLLGALVTGDLYERCAAGCAIPALATAFRHMGHDARRHQGALRALATREWPLLPAPQRTEAAAQVQTMAGFLSTALLDPAAPGIACPAGLGIPAGDQRLEALRTALLKVKDLQALYAIPFPALPHLAIPGTEANAV